MERLEDEAELLRAEPVEVADLRERLAVEVDLAGGGLVQRAQQVQQGRLAAAAGAHDGHVLAAADADRNVLDGVDLPVGIELREVFGAEQEGIAAVAMWLFMAEGLRRQELCAAIGRIGGPQQAHAQGDRRIPGR